MFKLSRDRGQIYSLVPLLVIKKYGSTKPEYINLSILTKEALPKIKLNRKNKIFIVNNKYTYV